MWLAVLSDGNRCSIFSRLTFDFFLIIRINNISINPDFRASEFCIFRFSYVSVLQILRKEAGFCKHCFFQMIRRISKSCFGKRRVKPAKRRLFEPKPICTINPNLKFVPQKTKGETYICIDRNVVPVFSIIKYEAAYFAAQLRWRHTSRERYFHCFLYSCSLQHFHVLFFQKMRIWVNKVNRMILVWVRMWRMEKVPGHGLCTANRPAGRPARRRNILWLFHSYTLPGPSLKVDHWSIFKEGTGGTKFRRRAGRSAGRLAVHSPWPGTFSIRHILTHTQIIRLTLLTQIAISWEKCEFLILFFGFRFLKRLIRKTEKKAI